VGKNKKKKGWPREKGYILEVEPVPAVPEGELPVAVPVDVADVGEELEAIPGDPLPVPPAAVDS
jgi:hypothetical protein